MKSQHRSHKSPTQHRPTRSTQRTITTRHKSSQKANNKPLRKHFSTTPFKFTPAEVRQLQEPVNLNFRKYNAVNESTEKPPLIILHGLLGQANNWANIASRADLRQDRDIYAVDLRNHGLSDRSPYTDYIAMANDVSAFVEKHAPRGCATIVGHSMGGKTAAAMGLIFPEVVAGVVVVDILPIKYPHESMEEINSILNTVANVDFSNGVSRREVDAQLNQGGISDNGIRQWLLTNVISVDGDDAAAKARGQVVRWKPEVKALQRNYEHIRDFDLSLSTPYPFSGPTHLILGGKSGFGNRDTALQVMQEHFPHCTLSVIEDAGHWCHAEKPNDFSAQLLAFLEKHDL